MRGQAIARGLFVRGDTFLVQAPATYSGAYFHHVGSNILRGVEVNWKGLAGSALTLRQ